MPENPLVPDGPEIAFVVFGLIVLAGVVTVIIAIARRASSVQPVNPRPGTLLHNQLMDDQHVQNQMMQQQLQQQQLMNDQTQQMLLQQQLLIQQQIQNQQTGAI